MAITDEFVSPVAAAAAEIVAALLRPVPARGLPAATTASASNGRAEHDLSRRPTAGAPRAAVAWPADGPAGPQATAARAEKLLAPAPAHASVKQPAGSQALRPATARAASAPPGTRQALAPAAAMLRATRLGHTSARLPAAQPVAAAAAPDLQPLGEPVDTATVQLALRPGGVGAAKADVGPRPAAVRPAGARRGWPAAGSPAAAMAGPPLPPDTGPEQRGERLEETVARLLRHAIEDAAV